MNKNVKILFLCILLIIFLSSCYDAQEIDDMVHIDVLGIDKGILDKWHLSVQFAKMKEPGSGGGSGNSESGGGKDQEYSVISIDAPSFFTGINMLNTTIARKFSFIHTQTIIFSEELAKSGLIGEYIAPINRFREIRRGAHIFVVKGSALEFLKENEPSIGTSISKTLQQLATESENTGFFARTDLEEFYRGIKSTYHQAIVPICAVNKQTNIEKKGKPDEGFQTGGEYIAGELPRTGENKPEVFGTALFKEDVMVGELNGDETRYMLMLKGDFKKGSFTLKDPKKPDLAILLEVRESGSPKIKAWFDGVKPVINININLDGDILAIQSGINYEHPKLIDIVETAFKEMALKEMEDLITKCQNLSVDIFNLGDYISKKFFTIDAWEEYDWNNHFAKANINVNIEFIIRRTGTQIKDSPIVSFLGW
jgi:spore germination protein KC